jgi:hypothetical protein
MKGERKLRLVPGGNGSPAGPNDEPPFSDEELAAAAELLDALDRGADPLAAALGAAHAPRPIAPPDLDAIVDRALGDEAASTAAERAAAERLRTDLEPGAASRGGVAEADLARALYAAVRPRALDPARNEALIEAALRVPLRRREPVIRRITARPVTMAALASVAAVAAGVALFVGQAPAPPSGGTAAAFVRARSADDLFDAATPFPRRGEESARVDRIASARATDLRHNRFAAWGVK